jgi:Glyoxalase/Bleomycin resistance protein/Dioxygenase superfamily
MASEQGDGVFPGGIRQFGFVVPDLDAALAQWLALGVAPWLVMRDLPMKGCRYRGELSEPVISMALSNTGDMQIELIQQQDDTPSIYREFLVATGGGFNQVAYWVEDFDAVRAAALADGWSEVWCGDAGGATKFSYVERPDSPAAIVELMELNDMTRAMGEAIRDAAAAWTPGQPMFMA